MRLPSKFSENSDFLLNLFFCVLLMGLANSEAVAQGINFELITGTQKYDDAKCIVQTYDSGYVVVGSTSGLGNGQSDIYLTKISKSGNVLWQQGLGGVGVEKGNALIQTPDSGFAITGYSNSVGTSGYDVYLAKTDADGNLLWSNTYGGFDWDFGNSVMLTNTGHYVICGTTYSYGSGNGDIYLLKTDASGILLWDSAYGGSAEDVGNAVCQAADGGYMVTGSTNSFGQGGSDVLLQKTDDSGNLLWTKSYGGTGDEQGNDGKLTAGSGFIVIGSSNSFSPYGFYENWMIRTDNFGDTMWSRRDITSGDRFATSIGLTADGGYIFTGYDYVFGDYNMFLYKTDAAGIYQDYKRYGGFESETAFCVRQTFDKGYVVVGTTESYGSGKPNIYLLKTDSNRVSTGIIQIVVGVETTHAPSQKINIFPNPCFDFFEIKVEEEFDIDILDVMGRIVSVHSIPKGISRIQVSSLPSTFYFVRLSNPQVTSTFKLTIKH